MKKPIYLIILISIFVASCGNHVRKLHKEEAIKVAKELQGDTSRVSVIDTSSLKIKETIDTTIVKKGFYIEDQISLDDTLSKDSIVENIIVKDNVTVKNSYNKHTKKLKTSVQAANDTLKVQMQREIVKRDGLTITGQNGIYKSKIDSNSTILVDDKEKHNYNGPNWTIILIALGIVVLLLFWIFGLPKRKR